MQYSAKQNIAPKTNFSSYITHLKYVERNILSIHANYLFCSFQRDYNIINKKNTVVETAKEVRINLKQPFDLLVSCNKLNKLYSNLQNYIYSYSLVNLFFK